MAHYVNMPELENVGKDIQTYAENEIRGEIEEMLQLGDKYHWVGPASTAFFDGYREILASLREYSDMVEKFGYFLRYVSEGYNSVGNESKEMFKKYVDELTDGKKKYLWEEDK